MKRKLLTDQLGDKGFVVNGFCNWKKALSVFRQHEQSHSHKEAVLKIEAMKQPSVISQLSSNVKKDQAIHRECLLATLSS